MQTTSRPRDNVGGYRGRHGPQISISDDNHHVTDAISSLYDYGEQQHGQQVHPHHQLQARGDGRPLSFLPAARDELHTARPSAENIKELRPARPLSRTQSDKLPMQPHQSHGTEYMVGRSNSAGHGPQPGGMSSPLRSPAETAAASFPLNDIDYESSPAAVAQELSNLQAIRRMSMDVNVAGDPDLPSFGPALGIPTAPPDDSTDEDDTSRLFWVPARLHPELAPKEFKTFLDSRLDSIKRRSGEFSLSPDSPIRAASDGGLRRKKSMLSRQIDTDGRTADGYQDGAERLDRKKSQSEKSERRSSGVANLQELEMLMHDPGKVMQRLSMESKQQVGESPTLEDVPILPAAPGGNSLRRSTRTTYRKGSLRQGERFPPSKRAARAAESDSDDLMSPMSPSVGKDAAFKGLTRVQTEPTPPLDRIAEKSPPENFSRPGRSARSRAVPQATSPPPAIEVSKADNVPPPQRSPPPPQDTSKQSTPPVPPVPSVPPFTSREPKPFVSQIASNGRTTATIPRINEPSQEEQRPSSAGQMVFPDRKSSIDAGNSRTVRASAPPSTVASKRVLVSTPSQKHEQQPQTLQHMAANPSPLPGNSTRTDSLSFIPTLTEDRRAPEPKKQPKKSSWSWGSLLGNEEKEKDRPRAVPEDDDIREIPRSKPKSKLGARPGDNTRLDVLQTSIDSSRTSGGRESLVLDRGDLKLEEERKKESSRKSAESREPSGRKDKDGGLLSSIFGGKKKSSDRDSTGSSGRKSSSLRPVSPEPPRPALKPDVDYNWTRFSILEERAIYRMAHIKLANPRRALYSQVLLSNFMYSYLAKVQQMHPQMQIPQSAAQKAAQQRAGGAGGAGVGAKKEEQQQQPEEFYQYQRYQQQLQAQDAKASQQPQQQQQQQQQQYQPYSASPTQPSGQNSLHLSPSQQYQYQQQKSLQTNGTSTSAGSASGVNFLDGAGTISSTGGGLGMENYLYQQQGAGAGGGIEGGQPHHHHQQQQLFGANGSGMQHSAYQRSAFDESEEDSDEDDDRLDGRGGAGEMW